MRLLLLVILALAAVAVGATYEPHGGCDYDFGAGNGTAYLVVNNPYNFVLSLNIIYQIGERKNSTVLNVPNTRVIAFCGLGHGWLYIQQNASQLRSPLAWYPLAVPRYVVLRDGESATMSVTTLFAPAATIAVAFLLLVAVALRPKLKRSTFYALPDALRERGILRLAPYVGVVLAIVIFMILLFIGLLIVLLTYGLFREMPFFDILELIRSLLSFFVGHVDDVGNDLLTEITALLIMYMTSSLGGFYMTFRRGLWTYSYLLISFLVNIFLFIRLSKSLLFFLLFTLSFTILLTSSVVLLSFYNLSMAFFLSVYGIARFIYYDANFGRTIAWSLPLQIPAIIPEIWIIVLPLIVTISIAILFFMIIATYVITMDARAVRPYMAFWPPLWWWFGLGVFALDELEARSLLHRLSAGGVVVELSRGRKAMVVSADLYGMYLCRLGEKKCACNDVEWVRYGEVKFKVSEIIKRGRDWRVVGRFVQMMASPILVGVSAFFMTKYTGLPIVLTFPVFFILFLLVYNKYDNLRSLKQYVRTITQDIKVFMGHLLFHLSWASLILLMFSLFISDSIVLGDVYLTALVTSFLLRADPELPGYLFPELELRLMSIEGLIVGLARGGCLQWAKGGGAPWGRAFVIRDGDCLVVVSPYVDNVRSRLQRYLCGPACPPVRVVVDEELQDLMNTRQPRSHKKQVRDVDWRRVAVGILNLRKRRYYYYIVDFPR